MGTKGHGWVLREPTEAKGHLVGKRSRDGNKKATHGIAQENRNRERCEGAKRKGG